MRLFMAPMPNAETGERRQRKRSDGIKIVCKEISKKAFSRVNSMQRECWEKEKRIMNSVGRMWNSSTGDGVLFARR